MKPVRRKIRRHFGLTAKQVAVRSHRPWYFQVFMAIFFIILGFGIAYWMLHDNESEIVRQQLQLTTQENKDLQTKLVGAQRELQIELATNNNLAKELASVQDDNIKIKEDLFFYKNMLAGKKPK
jgi:hypothetical protein